MFHLGTKTITRTYRALQGLIHSLIKGPSAETLGSFSNDDGNGNENAKKQQA